MNKNIIIIALLICLLASLIIGSMIISAKSDQNKGLQSTNSMLQADVQIRKNKEGKLLFETKAAQMKAKHLEDQLPELAKQMQRDFDVKLKNIQAYSQTDFRATGKGNALITRPNIGDTWVHDGDTMLVYEDGITRSKSLFQLDMGNMQMHLEYLTRPDGSMYYLYNSDTVEVTIEGANQFQPFALVVQDGYLDLQAQVYDPLNAPYEYTYGDTAKTAFIMRGKWFQKKQLYASTLFSNPNARILNTTNILVDQCKDRRWGIGPYVGYGLTSDGKLNMSFGLSVNYDLLKF